MFKHLTMLYIQLKNVDCHHVIYSLKYVKIKKNLKISGVLNFFQSIFQILRNFQSVYLSSPPILSFVASNSI